MPFKLKDQAFSWFKHIDRKPPLTTQFDLYYLCLLIGLISGKSDSPGQSQDFVGHFVDGYYPYRRIIAGLLLHTAGILLWLQGYWSSFWILQQRHMCDWGPGRFLPALN